MNRTIIALAVAGLTLTAALPAFAADTKVDAALALTMAIEEAGITPQNLRHWAGWTGAASAQRSVSRQALNTPANCSRGCMETRRG